MNAGQITRRFKENRDKTRTATAVLNSLKGERVLIEQDAKAWMEQEDVEKMPSANGIALRVEHRPVTTIADFDAFVKWAVANDFTHLLYKRAKDKEIQELAVEGVTLPDGVTMDSVAKVMYQSVAEQTE